MGSAQIGIVTIKDDLHALTVARHLAEGWGVSAAVMEVDTLSGTNGFTWAAGSPGEQIPTRLCTRQGETVDVRDLHCIWWRRVNYPQRLTAGHGDSPQNELINNDQAAALLGGLLTDFNGLWVSDPEATRRAENKLVQLRAAEQAGLRIPETLVTQDPSAVSAFSQAHGTDIIAKPVRGTHRAGLLTSAVDVSQLAESSIRACPTIYQRRVPGTKHLRVQVFGTHTVAALIDSPLLDWRADLRTGFEIVDLDSVLENQLLDVLKRLGLVMGVFDLKITDTSEPVWLEVNPQGQFLFIEALTGFPLARLFAEYLIDNADLL